MKMVMAILQKDDEAATIGELHEKEFFVTKLSTTGSLLQKKNTTILTVVEDDKVQLALDIIKKNSGERRTISYSNPSLFSGSHHLEAMPVIPMNVQVGGSTVFVLPVEEFYKF